MPTPNINYSERQNGFDLLRILACLGVVAIHIYTHKVAAFGQLAMPAWWEANIAFSISRWVVPAFVMISGYLLLGRSSFSPTGGEGQDEGEWRSHTSQNFRRFGLSAKPPHPSLLPQWWRRNEFLRRRLFRVGIPLLFWSVFYFLVRRYDDGAALDWKQVRWDVFYGQPYYHLYFLFVILGLYLMTPLFNRFIAWASPRQAFYTLFVLLGATMVYKWTEQFYPGYLPKANACTYWLRFAPVFLLGYYLRFVTLTRRRVVLGVVALVAMMCLLPMLNYASNVDWDRGSYFMAFLSPFVLLFAAIMVALAGHIAVPEKKWIRHMSDCTLGIYLLHPLIVDHWKGAPPVIELAGAFLGSYVVVAILRTFRPMRLLIG